MPQNRITLFPLNTVLFPGGPLPLRIFEPRYLKMVSDCMKNDRPFGVCLIKDGQEAGEPAVPHDIGTLARIEDWDQLEDGHLGLTARGGERFIVRHCRVDQDQLLKADIEMIEDAPASGIDEQFQPLVDVLRRALPRAGPLYEDIEARWDDPDWVAFRVAELMPPDNDFRLKLLRAASPQQRLAMVDKEIKDQSTCH
jgi:hypothetical protein